MSWLKSAQTSGFIGVAYQELWVLCVCAWGGGVFAFTCVSLCFRSAVGSVGGGKGRFGGWHDLWVETQARQAHTLQIRRLPKQLKFRILSSPISFFYRNENKKDEVEKSKVFAAAHADGRRMAECHEEGCCVKPLDGRQCFFLLTADLTHCCAALSQHCEISSNFPCKPFN